MDALLAAIQAFAAAAGASVGGFWGLVLNKVLVYGGKFLIDLIHKYAEKAKRAAEQKLADDNLKKVAADPKSSVDDVGKAYENEINSGR